MSLQNYYLDELSYLRDLGDEFARENPSLAPFISRQSNDPDVERLLEAFAFLSGRLRQKLDDEFPELSHSLIQVLWPHYLRPMPACSIVEYAVAGRSLIVPKGIELHSRPIDGTRCTFRSAYATEVRPLVVSHAEIENRGGGSVLHLVFRTTAGQTSDRLNFDRLRLHLSAEREPLVARTLYQWLRLYAAEILVEAPGLTARLPPTAIAPVGYDPEEDLLPYPGNAFDGFRLLQEYFACPDKFLFVDVNGLGGLQSVSVAQFSLTIPFNRQFPDKLRLNQHHVRVNCTPVVNLFAHDAQPLAVDHRRAEYRVRPNGMTVEHYSVFSVDQAIGWARATNQRTLYEPFESFRHALADASGSFYRTRVKPAVVRGQAETYVSFVNGRGDHLLPPSETVTLALTCTNSRLAQHVPIGGIDQASATTPPHLTFRNIAPVSPEIPPPIEGDMLWRLIANLARNYGSLADIEALRTVIGTYNFAAAVDVQARRQLELLLEGLRSSREEAFDWIAYGLPVRGLRFHLAVVESRLGGEAEAYLLGCVLDRFFALHAAINACHQLTMEGEETKVRFEWPVRFATRSTP
jgi:type VI secretion system protein ImpG